MKRNRLLGLGLISLALVACNPSTSRVDGGGTGTDSSITLRDGAAPPDGASADAGSGGPTDGGGPVSCGPQLAGDCDVRADIALAAGGSGPGSCSAGMSCIPTGPEMGGVLAQTCQMAGVLTDGADCDTTMVGQCAEGYRCSQIDNKCRRLCCANTDCAAGTQRCQMFTNVSVGICRLRGECNILMSPQTDCGTGQGCYHVGMGEGSCSPAGTKAIGESCAGLDECVPGVGCFSAAPGSSDFVCRAYCDPDAADSCGAFRCERFLEMSGGAPVPGLGFCGDTPD